MNGITVGEAVQAYVDSLGRKSIKTQRTYRSGLTHLLAMVDPGEPIAALDGKVLFQLYERLRDEGLASSSINTYLSAARRLYRYLIISDRLDMELDALDKAMENIAEERQERTARPLPTLPDEADIQALLVVAQQVQGNTPRRYRRAARDRALIETMRSTGARVFEIVGLDVGDLDRDDQAAIVRRGKGKKGRAIIFDDRAWQALMDYLNCRVDDLDHDTPIFIRLDRRVADRIVRLSTNSARYALGEMVERAGVKGKITPHAFRRRAGTALCKAAGIAAAQDLLGHASPETTRRYAQLDLRSLTAAHQAAVENEGL